MGRSDRRCCVEECVVLYGLAVFLLGLAATPIAIAAMSCVGVVDVPNERSSHERPTVRGAGVGVTIVAAVALIVAGVVDVGEGLLAVGLGSAAYAVLGMADDLLDLPALGRLPTQLVLGVGCVMALGTVQPWLLALAAGVAVAGYLNAYNFMDGINGISGLHAIGVGAAWAFAGSASDSASAVVLGTVVAGAALAFLPYNFPEARGFLGDVGSYFFGGCIAIGAVALYGSIPTIVIVLPLTPYAADTGWTLFRRVRRGEIWHEAHREHVYQRLLEVGWTHASSALLMAGLTVLAGAGGLAVAYVTDGTVPRALLVGAVAMSLVGYLCLPDVLRDTSDDLPSIVDA